MNIELDFDGAGDGRAYSIADSDYTSCYTCCGMGKLRNRHSIPVYTAQEEPNWCQEDWGVHDDHAKTTKFDRNFKEMAPRVLPPLQSSVDILSEYFCCPICKDPCIETTATNCGHKFCRQCIDKWKKVQRVCPVCSTWITSQNRLYSDDQFVESQLMYLRPEVRRRFQDAQRKRVHVLIDEQKNWNVIKKVRKSLDKSLASFKRKTFGRINTINSTAQRCYNKLHDWSERYTYRILATMLTGALFVLCFHYLEDYTQFLHYLWLALKNYNGIIPQNFLKAAPLPRTKNLVNFDAASTNTSNEGTNTSVLETVVQISEKVTSTNWFSWGT